MNNSLRPSLLSLLFALSACGGGGGGGVSAPANSAPTALFKQTCVDLTCAFENFSSDRDGDAITSSWAFGDASTVATTSAPSHTYASGGSYSVTLTVTDSRGATGSFVLPVAVTAAPAPAAPHASFRVACATPLECTFTDQSTYDAGSVPQSRTWDFGDNVVESATNPVLHRYTVSAFTTFTDAITLC